MIRNVEPTISISLFRNLFKVFSRGTLRILKSNVANRVEELKTFARSHEQVFFVGGLKSSNAKVLFEHCREANPNTLFVSSPDEIQKSDILPVETIGICGATSTPLWLMRACKDKIETLWNTTLKQSVC